MKEICLEITNIEYNEDYKIITFSNKYRLKLNTIDLTIESYDETSDWLFIYLKDLGKTLNRNKTTDLIYIKSKPNSLMVTSTPNFKFLRNIKN